MLNLNTDRHNTANPPPPKKKKKGQKGYTPERAREQEQTAETRVSYYVFLRTFG